MVGDAGDAAKGVVRLVARRIHFADDRVLGARHGGQGAHRSAHTRAPVVVTHRLQRSGWIGQS